MSDNHSSWGKHTTPHGDASPLFPVEELDGDVHHRRDARLRLDEVDEDDIIGVAPTSMASGYFLGQHDLAAVEIATLPEAIRERLEFDTDEYELVRVGRRREFQNRSLSEFAD